MIDSRRRTQIINVCSYAQYVLIVGTLAATFIGLAVAAVIAGGERW